MDGLATSSSFLDDFPCKVAHASFFFRPMAFGLRGLVELRVDLVAARPRG